MTPCIVYTVLGIELSALYMQECTVATQLHPSPSNFNYRYIHKGLKYSFTKSHT